MTWEDFKDSMDAEEPWTREIVKAGIANKAALQMIQSLFTPPTVQAT